MYSKYESALNICMKELGLHDIRYNGEPKAIHSIMVARVLEKYTKNEDMIAVALLHEIPLERLQKWHGTERKIFTKNNRRYLEILNRERVVGLSWQARSIDQLQEMAKAPWQVVMIKTADYIRNLDYILENFMHSSEVFAKRFGYKPKDVATIYSHLYHIARSHASIPKAMTDELAGLIELFRDRFNDSL